LASSVVSVDEVVSLDVSMAFVAEVVEVASDVGSNALLHESVLAEPFIRIAAFAVENQIEDRLDTVTLALPEHESDLLILDILSPSANDGFISPSTTHWFGEIFVSFPGFHIVGSVSHNVQAADATVSLISHDQFAKGISSTKELRLAN